MERQQELEWAKAQKLVMSADLVVAAKQQLRFLAEVDRNRYLYDGPFLDRAIYRYKYCWLPLLAKHTNSQVTEGPLVVPLDCEWIWHCHRLNPVRYRADCEEFYGNILGTRNVVSSVSVQEMFKKQTQEIWNRMYPNEPYELDRSTQPSENVVKNTWENQETTKYDLLSAVKRQASFFYQVSRPSMNDDLFLEGAVTRYKGFLYLIKRNKERSTRRCCVPTYDIDLIWHSHQLQPVSYCKDLVKILGKVLEHDDTDSDRTKGSKLDVGFSGTTKQWEETFGSRYWRAGAMYRGIVPSTVTTSLSQLDTANRKVVPSNDYENMIRVSEKMLVEVMVEIVAVKNIPAEHKGRLFVICGKKQPDTLFNTRRRLNVLSETEDKSVAVFHCEPTGELAFELMSYSPSALSPLRPEKSLGTISISLRDFMTPSSQLSIEKWFELEPYSGAGGTKPVHLRIALSFTSPVPEPYVLNLVQNCPFSSANGWVCVQDEAGNEVINIQMRDSTTAEARNNELIKREVIGMTASGETFVVAEFSETAWSLMNSSWLLQLQSKFSSEKENIFELSGGRKVIIFPGRKLEYEERTFGKQEVERNFMTAVQFSEKNPYGKAVALLNLESGSLKISEKWLLLPGILMAFLLSSGTMTNGVAVRGFKVVHKWNGRSGEGCDSNSGDLVIGSSCGECATCVDGDVYGVGEVTENDNTEVCVGDYKKIKSGCFGPCGAYSGCDGSGCTGDCAATYNFKAVNCSAGIGAIPNIAPTESSQVIVGDHDSGHTMKSTLSAPCGGGCGGCSHCHAGCSHCHGGCRGSIA